MTHYLLTLQLVAITNATVIDVASGTKTPGQTILVEGRRISMVGPTAATTFPAGARVIDATGKFVVPGFWDMHVHVDVPGGRALIPLYVAYGVTGVRDMNGSLGNLRRLQREITGGQLVGPRMVVSGPYVAGAPVPLPHVIARTATAGAAAVDSLHKLGVDFIKVHNAVPPEAFFAVARTARARGIIFAGHVFPPLTPLQASDSGIRSQEHLTSFPNECTPADSAAFAAALPLQRFLLGACTREPQTPIYTRIARNNTWITPTLTVQRPLADLVAVAQPGSEAAAYYSDSLLALMRLVMPMPPNPPAAARDAGRAMLAKRVAMVGTMQRAGIPILTGTDSPIAPSPPGLSLHDELELLVRAGLSPLAALRAATVEPARYFAATDSLGSVATGKVADLLLLDADPTVDIRNSRRISVVLADGRVYDAAARSALVDAVKQHAGASRNR